MDIRFYSVSKLKEFKPEFKGYFVNLYKHYNNYQKGLYFGGDEGWELLSNVPQDKSSEIHSASITDDGIIKFYNSFDKTGDVLFELSMQSILENINSELNDLNSKVDNLTLDSNHILMDKSSDSESEDFLTVLGVEIGNIKPGDKITKDTSLGDLLKKMLVKELDGCIYTYPSSKIHTSPITEGEIVEVNKNINLNVRGEFIDGTFKTYQSPSEYLTINAGCEVIDKTYFYNSEQLNGNNDIFVQVVDGTNTISCDINYSQSTKKPITNSGKVSNIQIPSDTTTCAMEFIGSYKCWYGILPSFEYTIKDLNNDDIEYLKSEFTESWVYKSLLFKEINLNKNEIIYVMCPAEYTLKYETSLSNDIIAKCNSSVIEYHLDDDTIKQYKLYYIPNEDKYMNIRLQK